MRSENGCEKRKRLMFLGIEDIPPLPLGSMRLVVDTHLPKDWIQVRFPKTKKRRIRKKWEKRSENYQLRDVGRCYQMGHIFIMSPAFYEKLKKSKHFKGREFRA